MTARKNATLRLGKCSTGRDAETREDPSVKKRSLFFILIVLSVFGGGPERATAVTFNSLYSFLGGDDGGQPQAALVEGSDGNFYGTTFAGGAFNTGTVFRIGAAGSP